jgi:hypothetical protein
VIVSSRYASVHDRHWRVVTVTPRTSRLPVGPILAEVAQ